MTKLFRSSLLAAAAGLFMSEEVGAAGGGTANLSIDGIPQDDATASEAAPKRGEVIGADQPVPAGMVKQVFHFKKEAVKDAAGNKIADGKKLPSVALLLPAVSADTILTVFADPAKTKEQQFVLDQLQQAVYLGARDQINLFREKNPGVDVPLAVLDHGKLTIEALTAAAEESGSSSRITDEDWASFYEDWKATMLATEWTQDNRDKKVDAQINFFQKNLRRSRDKKVLGGVQQLLQIYAANSKNLADNVACFENLSAYVEKWVNYEPQDVLASILG
jgi:hypothetical protein